jgi:hypothetical protein
MTVISTRWLSINKRKFIPLLIALIIVPTMLVAWLLNPLASQKAHAGSSLPPGVAATVSINATNSLGQIPKTAFGLNAAVWDGNLMDTSIPSLLSSAGVNLVRYPGGSTSDVYHWQSNSVIPGQSYANPSNNFDAFMSQVHKAGAQNAMVTVNYGSGTPAEAAGWVQYANKGNANYAGPVPTYSGGSATGHNYGVKYWEIGNEIYGDGTYGADWEYETNPIGSATYANNVVSYSNAMKAVDPSIKIGVVLTAPGNWPDGVTSSSSPQPWNDTVLPIACSSIDFVVIHWYSQGPGGESDAGLLAAPENGESTSVSYTPSISSMVATLRSEINQYCGAHANNVQIAVTETNSVSYNLGKQTVSLVNGLFLADSYMTWLENGVANVDWWDLFNGAVGGNNNSSSLYGNANYGDYGVLSSGTCLNDTPQTCEPPADTPFPPYYGLQMLTHLGRAGDAMISASSNTNLVTAHAVRQKNGKLAVLLVNKDPSNTYNVTVTLNGTHARGIAKVYRYGENNTAISDGILPVNGKTFTVSVAPYSLNTVTLP